ncbi:MAG: TetR/AcrR family transcriptional regulator [Spirochaetes bacterium]|nr:TetR/AcrR family transcriptional regulator [Spirochaetota bacterium]
MKELLDAAAELFVEKGYQRTTVQDILDRVGVAKGTFYHYFDAKVDLLHELAERFMEVMNEELARIAARDGVSAMEKIRLIAELSRSYTYHDRKLYTRMILKALYMEENLELRHHLLQVTRRKTAGIVGGIFRQGVQEGSFTMSDPENTALILMMMDGAVDDMAFGILTGTEVTESDIERVIRIYSAYEEAVCRMLGIRVGEIQMMIEEDVRRFIAEYIQSKQSI